LAAVGPDDLQNLLDGAGEVVVDHGVVIVWDFLEFLPGIFEADLEVLSGNTPSFQPPHELPPGGGCDKNGQGFGIELAQKGGPLRVNDQKHVEPLLKKLVQLGAGRPIKMAVDAGPFHETSLTDRFLKLKETHKIVIPALLFTGTGLAGRA
jgi:hypothetical protein